jgi:hypothetical protein
MVGYLRVAFIAVLAAGSVGCASAPSGAGRLPKARTDPNVITLAEIDSEPFRDVYDIVQRLRPSWYTQKSGGASARRMGASSSNSAIGAGLVVYLDNSMLGGVDALHQLSPNAIESLRFLDAAAATAMLPGIGTRVISGAIVAHSRRGL